MDFKDIFGHHSASDRETVRQEQSVQQHKSQKEIKSAKIAKLQVVADQNVSHLGVLEVGVVLLLHLCRSRQQQSFDVCVCGQLLYC